MEGKQRNLYQALTEDDNNKRVYRKLMVFMLLILILPFITFFLLKDYVLLHYTEYSDQSRNFYSGISAVIVVQLLIFMYIYAAMMEEDFEEGSEVAKKAM